MNKFSMETIKAIAREKEIPISVVIEITTKCNWLCKHCYIPEHIDYGISFEKLREILLDFRKVGVFKITYTGGEIFTRKDMLEIIEYTRKQGFSVSILSNVSMVTPNIARKFAECSVQSVSMTIFSLNEKIHDGITMKKGSLKAALRGIKLLAENNIPLWVKTPIMKDNFGSFFEVKEWAERNGFAYTASSIMLPKTNGDMTPKGLQISPNEFEKVVKELDELTHFRSETKSEKLCQYLSSSFAVNSSGDVYPCNSLYLKMGNLFEQSIFEIWASKTYHELRNLKNSEEWYCNSCNLESYCDKCPATKLMEHKNFFDCSDESKKRAITRKKVKLNES